MAYRLLARIKHDKSSLLRPYIARRDGVLRRGMVRGHKNPLHYGLPGRLRAARKTAGLTRAALAQKVGGDQTTALDIETNQRRPNVGTVLRLAAALGVSGPWLAYGLGEQASAGIAASCDGMAERLRTERTVGGHTRTDLARLATLTPGTIAHIEDGGQAKVQTIEALAQALGISPGWLAYGVGDRELPPSRRGRPPAQSPDPAA